MSTAVPFRRISAHPGESLRYAQTEQWEDEFLSCRMGRCHTSVRDGRFQTTFGRLERGTELLDEGAGSISEVAYAIGFNSPT